MVLYKLSKTAPLSVLSFHPSQQQPAGGEIRPTGRAHAADYGCGGLASPPQRKEGKVAPSAKLRASAEYDAANYLVELKDWPRAIKVMTDFRARYPQHAQIATLPPKLALSYRETEQWELAAKELYTMYEGAKTEAEKRDTLYIVAELYDRAKNKKEAILALHGTLRHTF